MKSPVNIILSPRITEKGALLSSVNGYAFHVAKDATKKEVAQAIKTVFNVMPTKVTFVAIPRKVSQTRGTNRKGLTAGGKKAYVFLKKGDTIEIA
ncbi:50S ribosomal protein L23 [Candidatus Parcubacteria bacterium]|nr:50S ribosomal protein L23 [Candidatus Parcubacteria bacterium]